MHPRLARNLIRLLAVLLCLLLGSAAGVAALLGTETGRVWLAESGLPWVYQEWFSGKSGNQIQLEQVQSPSLGDWTVGQIRFTKAGEPVFIGRTITLRWSPSALLDPRIDIQQLSAEAVEVFSQSKPTAVEQPAKQRSNSAPKLIEASLQALQIDRLQVHHPKLPVDQSYRVQGQIKVSPTGPPVLLDLSLQTLAGKPLTIDIQSTVMNAQQAQIRADLDETAGGWLGTLLRLPATKPLRARAELNLAQIEQQIALDIERLETSYQGHALSLEGALRTSLQSPVALTWDLRVQTDQLRHQSKGALQGEQLQATVDLDHLPLDLLDPWLPEPLPGSLTTQLSLSGNRSAPMAKGNIDLTTRYRNQPWYIQTSGVWSRQHLQFDHLDVTSNQSRAQANGSVNLAEQTLALNVETKSLPLSFLRALEAPLPPEPDGNLSADLSLIGAWKQPQIQGHAEFDGRYRDIPFRLAVEGQGHVEHFELAQLTLTTQKYGKLTASGVYDPKALDLALNAQAIPTGLAAVFGWDLHPGELNADLLLQGSFKRPILNGQAQLSSTWTQVSDNGDARTIPIEMQATASTSDQRMTVRTVVRERSQTLGHITAEIPLQVYLNAPPDSALPLKGRISADMELAHLRVLYDPVDQRFGGRLQANLTLDGRIDVPNLEGEATLSDGHYEHDSIGTRLTQIHGKLVFNQRQLTLQQLRATDGGEGRLDIEGNAKWAPNQNPTLHFSVRPQNLQVLQRHDLEGLANGTLTLDGQLPKLLLAGTLDISPFTVYLDNMSTLDIPELKVVEVRNSPDKNASSKAKPSGEKTTIKLDLTLKTDQQGFLRGQGLQAELSGKIRVTGTLARPVYTGRFQTVRGYYEILGKKFILKDGWVRFEGNSIALFIPGVHRTGDIEIRAELSGTREDLKLVLSSTPVLPQDEILSRLLFGKSAQSISPFQAIRLASALNALRGGGGSLFDPIEATRSLIGADTINVDTEETDQGNGVTVGVGKYVSEKVYIEVEKGSNASQPWKSSVEVEISPNLSVESTTGGDSGLGGIELQWKHDY